MSWRVGRNAALALLAQLVAAGLGERALVAQTPPESVPGEVRHYTAYRASAGLSIDGRIDETAWEEAPWTEGFVDIRGPAQPDPAWRTAAKILWDDDFLYVAGYLVEPHVWATLRERDAIIYRDNDFEVFLDPEGDAVGYYEFELNAFGTLLDLYMDRPYKRGGTADLEWNAQGMRWAVYVDGRLNNPEEEDRGWSIEMAVPWSSLIPPGSGETRGPPTEGDVWRVNFSRVQWPSRIVDGRYQKVREAVDWSDHPEHNWVWSPQGSIDMHIPERWGAVIFRGVPVPGGDEGRAEGGMTSRGGT